MIDFNGQQLKFEFNFGSRLMYEALKKDGLFNPEKLEDRTLMYFSMLLYNNKNIFTLDFEHFVEEFDKNISLFNSLDSAFVQLMKEANALAPEDEDKKKAKKV